MKIDFFFFLSLLGAPAFFGCILCALMCKDKELKSWYRFGYCSGYMPDTCDISQKVKS